MIATFLNDKDKLDYLLMSKYKVGILGLRMGQRWAEGAWSNQNTELCMGFDPNWDRNESIDRDFFLSKKIYIAKEEEEIYNSDLDIVVVASPDHFHVEQCVKALENGKHVICEKPLAGTVAGCKEIISATRKSGQCFMVGQVGRYACGFKLAKMMIEQGRIGDICFIESEYAHDYNLARGFDNWRCDHEIRREGFIGGGCHALDLVRWLAGDPVEIFCYTNRLHLPEWPTDDTGIAVMKFPGGVIGKVFVSIGVKRPYTMRTVINGTKGTIICDNTSNFIQISEVDVYTRAQSLNFMQIPVVANNHNVAAELADFVEYLENNEIVIPDVYQGAKTVAVGEAALESARTGKAVKVNYNLLME